MDGRKLIAWGFKPGQWFKTALEIATAMERDGRTEDEIFQHLQDAQPVKLGLRTNALPIATFIDAEDTHELANVDAVMAHMDALVRTPTIKNAAVMPDACPSGMAIGTIPVGGVVACEDAIHPGFHSSDICCSVAISIFKRDQDPKQVLDAFQEVTHFGPVGKNITAPKLKPSGAVMSAFETNPFLKGLEHFAIYHLLSQGDGNHFAYVGRMKSTGAVALVTHHGSRGLGAQLYKRGMAAAKTHLRQVGEKLPEHNAWIKASSQHGVDYWKALQVVRQWTKENHFGLHDLLSKKIGNSVSDRFWNEHNFVFQKSDGLFYHGKGATPSWPGFAHDDSGLSLIPLNMAEPILICAHKGNAEAMEFAPHGAGRYMGRKVFLRDHQAEMPKGIDARFYCGVADHSELPAAYKKADAVRAQIAKYKLADVVDEVIPYGCIMAGDWEVKAPWRERKG